MQSNADKYKAETRGIGLDTANAFHREPDRELQRNQLEQYRAHLSTIRECVHEALSIPLLRELISIIKAYVSEVDHQSLVVLKYFPGLYTHSHFDGGAVWYRQGTSSKPGFDEYAAENGALIRNHRPDGPYVVQISMYHRVSTKFTWILQTMRSLISDTPKYTTPTITDMSNQKMVNVNGSFLATIVVERTLTRTWIGGMAVNEFALRRLFIPHTLYDSPFLDDSDRDFLTCK